VFIRLRILKTCTLPIYHYHAAIIKAKRTNNSSIISSSSTNPRQLWKNINILLHHSSFPVLPSYNSLSLLSQYFPKFFCDKIHKLHTSLLINRIYASTPPFTPLHFLSFTCVTTDEVYKLHSQSPYTACNLNPIHVPLLKKCSHILLSTVTNIISTGIFPNQFKNCSVHQDRKKYNLDKNNIGNYCPISHLIIVKTRWKSSKITYQQPPQFSPICLLFY